jgi:hypothetical protein
VIFIIFCSFVSGWAFAQKNTNGIVWKAGMAFRNGKAVYFDPDKLPMGEFYVSRDYLTNQKKYYPIFPGGKLFWNADEEGNLAYYSMPVSNISDYIIESEQDISYMISNEAIYLQDTNTGWEKMEFRLIKTNPDPDVIYRIYLKSRWFEGEYDIFRP